MAASVDFKTYVDQACRAADEFVNIYYETMDKRRRALTRLYLDKATLVWNGNAVSGQEELNKFFEMLPSSEFQVNVLDCQPVHGFLEGELALFWTSQRKLYMVKLVLRRRDGLLEECRAIIYFYQSLFWKIQMHIHAEKEKLVLKLLAHVFKRSNVHNILRSVQ
ncbi:NTF2-related export protein 2 isoform X1 [Cyanistes caeruleus]|uniref:NTF2-related export protein 2 isoform X1 n=1 Tax=Cyanistes caeruleus TaxID=156563 RepID=UPI000CDA009B|nr:NTF2-related export protein 2 isoform X1 [Cyanistes caeruleus]